MANWKAQSSRGLRNTKREKRDFTPHLVNGLPWLREFDYVVARFASCVVRVIGSRTHCCILEQPRPVPFFPIHIPIASYDHYGKSVHALLPPVNESLLQIIICHAIVYFFFFFNAAVFLLFSIFFFFIFFVGQKIKLLKKLYRFLVRSIRCNLKI